MKAHNELGLQLCGFASVLLQILKASFQTALDLLSKSRGVERRQFGPWQLYTSATLEFEDRG